MPLILGVVPVATRFDLPLYPRRLTASNCALLVLSLKVTLPRIDQSAPLSHCSRASHLNWHPNTNAAAYLRNTNIAVYTTTPPMLLGAS